MLLLPTHRFGEYKRNDSLLEVLYDAYWAALDCLFVGENTADHLH